MSKDEATSKLTIGICHTIDKTFCKMRSKLYNWKHLAWLILFVSFLNVICIGGKRRAFGIFIAALKVSYNDTSMTELNWVGDSYAAIGFFLMPFVTTAIFRFNRPYRFTMLMAGIFIFISCMTSATVPSPGYLFLTHTVLHGFGSTLILCGTSLITGEYFDKSHPYHVLATAFVSGGPYGVLLFGPLFSYWIQTYNWRTAFEFSGILFLLVSWLGAITFLPKIITQYDQYENQIVERELVPNRENNMSSYTRNDITLSTGKRTNNNADDTNDLVVIRQFAPTPSVPNASGGKGWAFCSIQHMKDNPQIYFWAGERLVHNLIVYGLLMNLTSYVNQALDYKLVQGAQVNLYFGVGESAIFTFGALIGDRIKGHLPMAYFAGSVLAAVFLLILQKSYTNLNMVYLLAGFTGVTIGVGNTFLYATAEEVMHVHGSIAFPMTKMMAGIGMLLAPLFSGLIIDKYGYKGFFISMVVLISIRVLLMGIICYILHRKKRLAKIDHFQLIKSGHCCDARQELGQFEVNSQKLSNYQNYNNWYVQESQKIP